MHPVLTIAQEDVAALEEQAIKSAVARVAPSVLKIETVGGLEQVGRMLVSTGPTTGLVVSDDGYVVSSAFNFVQLPSSILVTLPSGKRATAEIVARDRSRMLVLLKVHTDEALAVPEFVSRGEMVVGQWTIAVGRTFDGDQPNVSAGVLSARNRIWSKAIQTDARISPSNYGGPLVDIHGRVLGILVPLSPQRQNEIAGAEWYDSGIGFAIPLIDIVPRLDRMKAGEDLHPGLLGITLKGNDMYSEPVEIAACLPKSPAYIAGLKAGDRIIEVDGTEIQRQAQLKHVLGPRYAGDQVQLVAMRDDQRIEVQVELADKLEPYENPFVGILPDRSPSSEPGVVVRYVYPGSPADEAGLVAEDRLVRLDEKPLADLDGALEILANLEPGNETKLTYERGGESTDVQITLAGLPKDIPGQLPVARAPAEPTDEPPPAVGEVEIKIPEEKNECFAYVPEDFHPTAAYGVVLWLQEPGEYNQQALLARWKDHCQADDLILLVPQPADASRWQPTELDFIRKTLDEIISRYNVDRRRIVASGYQAGGAMAILTAFTHRGLVRAVAVNDASLPARISIPPNDPIERLALCLTVGKESKLAKRVRANVEALEKIKYPVILREHEGEARPLDTDELAELVRWIDTLDRL
jgi:serine protease Do